MSNAHQAEVRFFSLLLCFDATKYVFQGVFTLIETICPKTWANRGSRMQNVYFRLMLVAEKRHCLRDGPLEKLWGGRGRVKYKENIRARQN